jgi:hypothetical protein
LLALSVKFENLAISSGEIFNPPVAEGESIYTLKVFRVN